MPERCPAGHNNWVIVQHKKGYWKMRCVECYGPNGEGEKYFWRGNPAMLNKCEALYERLSCPNENCECTHVHRYRRISKEEDRVGVTFRKPRRRSSNGQGNPATRGQGNPPPPPPAPLAVAAAVAVEEELVEAARQETADPLPVGPGDWQGAVPPQERRVSASAPPTWGGNPQDQHLSQPGEKEATQQHQHDPYQSFTPQRSPEAAFEDEGQLSQLPPRISIGRSATEPSNASRLSHITHDPYYLDDPLQIHTVCECSFDVIPPVHPVTTKPADISSDVCSRTSQSTSGCETPSQPEPTSSDKCVPLPSSPSAAGSNEMNPPAADGFEANASPLQPFAGKGKAFNTSFSSFYPSFPLNSPTRRAPAAGDFPFTPADAKGEEQLHSPRSGALTDPGDAVGVPACWVQMGRVWASAEDLVFPESDIYV